MSIKKASQENTSLFESAPRWSNPEVTGLPIEGFRYTSNDFFHKEWEGMWTKVWLLLGRENEISEVGEYQVEEIGQESILMIRQSDGEIKAFYNVCQHRGSRLVNNNEGKTEIFTCPYHSWKWAHDGTLLSVQDPEDFLKGNPCESLTLTEIACEVFAGFIWVNMDSEPGSLKEYLGPLWDDWSSYQMDDWSRVLTVSAQVPCNWKVIQDNFCESYHLPSVHPQLADSHEENYTYTQFDMSDEGHNRMVMLGATPSRSLRGDNPVLHSSLVDRMSYWDLDPTDFEGNAYAVRNALQKKMKELGPERGHMHYKNLRDAQLTDSHHYNLFPNCSLTFAADGVLLQRMRPDPTDPQKCFFDHWYYTRKSSDAEITDLATNIELDREGNTREVFRYGEKSMGLIPDQDIAIAVIQQLGLRSRGFKGGFLSDQETRIRRFHDVIDEYIN